MLGVFPRGDFQWGRVSESHNEARKNPIYQIRDVFCVSQNCVPPTPVSCYSRTEPLSRHYSSICVYIDPNSIYLQGCTYVCHGHCVLQPYGAIKGLT